MNTAAILGGCGTAGIAARLASSYTGGGCTDWFLPSKDELNELYLQQGVVGGFASGYYWSSSENNAVNAWGQVFGGGVQGNGNKDLALRVRAVRGF